MHDRKTPKEKADALFRQLKAVPRELRDHIYGYILSERTNIVISAERFERDNRGDLSMPKPALLNTCKQVRRETAPVYYAVNTFVSSSRMTTMSGRCRSLGSWHSRIVREKT